MANLAKRVWKNCDGCGHRFSMSSSDYARRVKRGAGFFHNKKCRSDWLRRQVTLVCTGCGEPIQMSKREYNQRISRNLKLVFHNRECYDRYYRRIREGETPFQIPQKAVA